jgi:hypothetical protein
LNPLRVYRLAKMEAGSSNHGFGKTIGERQSGGFVTTIVRRAAQ